MTNPSLSGQRLGAYEVGPLIGAGGMGEVYRARDSKLNRDIAIKVLLPAVASDAERLARFRREAQTLASLNHPGIAQIHGLEDSSSGPFLVMELVEGPTLADRIAAGPLPTDEAIAIGREIVDALEAAHERGIVHRDLKPANIKVRDDGTVKILDFGLAKALDRSEGDGFSRRQNDAANSPTITSPAMTQVGLILGTAAYMSPEQAKGRVVDKRTDVWAFGCVLYEMLTGRRTFDGEDVTETIAAVVRGEPDWSVLPKDTPAKIRLLLKRCLDKDRRARIGDVSVARFLLNETIDAEAAPRADVAWRGSRRLMAAGGGLIVAAALAAAMWGSSPRTREADRRPVRFVLTTSSERPLQLQGNDKDIALAPDGSFVVYRTTDTTALRARLMIRMMHEVEARELPGTESARQPFVSPDGAWVGFFAGVELRKVPVAGGGSILICRIAGQPRGASWGDDGDIVYAVADTRGLMRVRGSGGEPAVLLAADAEKGDVYSFPHVLPGAKTVLFVVVRQGDGTVRIEALDVISGARKTIIASGSDPSYVEPGYLVLATGGFTPEALARGRGLLRVTRFDVSRLETSGDAATLADPVILTSLGAMNYSISRGGDLVFVPGGVGNPSSPRRKLVWVDRKGRETPLTAGQRTYTTARISPDGTGIALDLRDQNSDIWVWDINRQTLSVIDRDPGQDMSPLWTPDSTKIVWASSRHGGNPNLFTQSADGSGSAERLTNHATNQFPTSITPDGRTIVLFGVGTGQTDIFTVNLDGNDRTQKPLIVTTGHDLDPEISPDGKWIAYHSSEAGDWEVFVRPFPNVNDGRTQISAGGGSRAAWARNGKELFYLDKDGYLTSVAVQTTGSSFAAGKPTKLLSTKYYLGSSVLGLDLRAYDVSADGQRFLMIKDADGAAPPNDAPRMVVVLNGATVLKQLLPTP